MGNLNWNLVIVIVLKWTDIDVGVRRKGLFAVDNSNVSGAISFKGEKKHTTAWRVAESTVADR